MFGDFQPHRCINRAIVPLYTDLGLRTTLDLCKAIDELNGTEMINHDPMAIITTSKLICRENSALFMSDLGKTSNE